jgi:aryl-alcohol dehydrogenase-like predicted oxidoreductase/enamine deaminase RidA (YjgF/YER057c/UK114 family)
MTVERHTLAPGLTISRVLTGLWQVADLERDGRTLDHDVAAAAMGDYAARGLTTFDMADHYGSAELIAGRFAGGVTPRARCAAAHQVGAGHRDRSRATTCAPTCSAPSIACSANAWISCSSTRGTTPIRRGSTRCSGSTSCAVKDSSDSWASPTPIRRTCASLRASGIPVVSNQVCWSLLDTRPRARMAAYALQEGVSLLAYGTVAGGFLSDRWLDRAEPNWDALETWSQMKYGRFVRTAGGWDGLQRVLRAARAVADRHGVSIANVACRYVLEQPSVGGIIVGARLGSSEHIDDTLRLFSFSLSDEDHAELESAVAQLETLPGEPGDEYRVPPFLTASGDLSHHVASFPSPYPVRVDANGRQRVLSGTVWERDAGYARAVRVGNQITVSGTTATHGSRVIGGSDPSAQAHAVIDKLAGSLQALGSRLEDVVRTRIFVSDIAHWEPVARAHGERFGHIQPANTLVQAPLVGHEYLVEIEADAIVSDA